MSVNFKFIDDLKPEIKDNLRKHQQITDKTAGL